MSGGGRYHGGRERMVEQIDVEDILIGQFPFLHVHRPLIPLPRFPVCLLP